MIIDRRDDQSGCSNTELFDRRWREFEQTRDLAEIERREGTADEIIAGFICLIVGFCLGLWWGMP